MIDSNHDLIGKTYREGWQLYRVEKLIDEDAVLISIPDRVIETHEPIENLINGNSRFELY